MGGRFFSTKKRLFHLGPYPLERLARTALQPDLNAVPLAPALDFSEPHKPDSLLGAMGEYQAMMDAIRAGPANPEPAAVPSEPAERARHMKAFGYFQDCSMVGICALPAAARRATPLHNPGIDRLSEMLRTRQTKTLASGIDEIMAALKESIAAPPGPIDGHSHAIVCLVEYQREPRPDEPGADWITGLQAQRAALRASEAAVVLASYLQLLGFSARAHSASASDVSLERLALAAGLARPDAHGLRAPFIGAGFGLAAVSTDMAMAVDRPLAPGAERHGDWRWWLGAGSAKGALNRDPYRRRRYVDGALPFESIRRVQTPTTYIDEARVARVPKRSDMFARAQFGDMGERQQRAATGGWYARKSAHAFAQRRLLGALVLLQDGAPAPREDRPADPVANAAQVKAASYFLGLDAVGLSRCPDWAWYSHDATGAELHPPHDQAISMVVDQGFETMEGASGDDWIAVAQSMRAYLRFSLLGGVIAAHIRSLGYAAKAHTVLDGEVLQPPLLLLSGLGEVSRIGEVILNPLLGPRLKSGVVSTDMPLAHDQPIDFGLQRFCEQCNKCARECPAGAITAGPKLMFNGYEIWKSDSQKCTTYRITTEGGAMCGRCMKTCPWNLEGLFREAPVRWLASHFGAAAPALVRLDDRLGHGEVNDAKKWWWDLERGADGGYRAPAAAINRRALQPQLRIEPEEQTLAVYPAPLAPWPWPYPFAMDREAGIAAHRAMMPAAEHRARLAAGEVDGLVPQRRAYRDPPVIAARVAGVEPLAPGLLRYALRAWDGGALPAWTAGAHIDVVVAPEFLRSYSLCGDPAQRGDYQIAVQREAQGRGGSALMQRIFSPGRRVFISPPINHFALDETAGKVFLMGGGIGITPMLAFAHRLHALGTDFCLHYSASRELEAGFAAALRAVPWAERVHMHFSDRGQRADFDQLLAGYRPGWQVYSCGPDRYVQAVLAAAERAGYPESARRWEYFAAPERAAAIDHPFAVQLARSGRRLDVPADQTLADVLSGAGVAIDLKCSDGICGVCKCGLLDGAVDHRDHVLSAAQREREIITCQSRAREAGGVLTLDL